MPRQALDGARLEASTPDPLLSATSMVPPPPTVFSVRDNSEAQRPAKGMAGGMGWQYPRWTLKGCVDVTGRRGGEHREAFRTWQGPRFEGQRYIYSAGMS